MSSPSGEIAQSPPPGIIADLQNPADVLRTVTFVTNVLALGITTLVTVGRFYVRFWITKAVFIEDWFCAASWFMNVGWCTLGLLGSVIGGGGYHVWEISASTLVNFQKIEYAAIILYGPCTWCIKVALLLTLVRVFTPFRKIIWAIWAFILAMLVYTIIATVLKIFICAPIHAVWDRSATGKCLDASSLFSVDTSLSILTDLVILVLPIPLVWTLQVSIPKKLRTIALLGAGGVATASGIIRLILILQLNASPYSLGDPTVSIARINLLVTAELAIGIICACLPAFNIFFAAERARSMHNSKHQSQSHSRSNSNSKFHNPSRSNSTLEKWPLELSTPPTSFPNAKIRDESDGRVGDMKEQYIEIGTPRDLGKFLGTMTIREKEGEEEGEEGMGMGIEGGKRESWPLRTRGMERYLELRREDGRMRVREREV